MKHGLMLLMLLVTSGVATAATFELPAEGIDVVGEISSVTTDSDDTLLDIAQRYGFGYEEIMRANPGVDVWVPGEGTEVRLPGRFLLPAGPRKGIVLNIAEYRLYYFPEPRNGAPAEVMTFPVSIGRQDWETPLGMTKVVQKVVNPSWYVPQSVLDEHEADGRPLPKIVPPGPDNPLGARAMRLGLPGYLIHGTNRPAGVGMRVTHGCLRMFPEDIEFLFELVAVNTQVRIVNEPVKLGWDGDELVMEVHPVLASGPVMTADVPVHAVASDRAGSGEAAASELSDSEFVEAEVAEAVLIKAPAKDPLTYVTEQFVSATDTRAGELDWWRVEEVVQRADGIPVVVGSGIKNAATSAASE